MSLPNTIVIPHGSTEARLVEWLRSELRTQAVIHRPYGREERAVSMRAIQDILVTPPFDRPESIHRRFDEIEYDRRKGFRDLTVIPVLDVDADRRSFGMYRSGDMFGGFCLGRDAVLPVYNDPNIEAVLERSGYGKVAHDLGEHTLSGTVTIDSGAVLTMTGAGKFAGTFSGNTATNLNITGGTYPDTYLGNRDTTLSYSSNSDGTFTVTSEFTVTFVIDGTEIERTVAYGGTVSGVPSLPSDPGYTYAWTVGGEEWDPSAPVTENITVTAIVTGQTVDQDSDSVEIHIKGVNYNDSKDSVKIWWGTCRLILDQDYTLTEGSIVVTLTDTFLDRLRAEGDSAQSLSIQYMQGDVKQKITYGLEVGSDDQTPDVTPPSYDDDELPPFIPSQTGGDDTVTIVACAAAAAVAAIMAVFLIIDRKK